MSSNPLSVPLVSAADLRHQLRTPLNHIVGYSEILLDEQPSEAAAAHLSAIIDQARLMLDSVQQRLGAQQGLVSPTVIVELRGELAARVDRVRALLAELGPMLNPQSAPDLARIESAADALARFWPEPSAVDADGLAPGSWNAPRQTPAAAGRILVVDDNEANRDMLARQLEKQGHEVSTAADGMSALQQLRAKRFDVVLLDLMMPGMNGFEVLQQVKADPALYRVAVILVSALDEMEGVARSIEAGAEDYLFKPVNPTLLRARIQSALEKIRVEEAITRKQRFESIGMLAAGIAHDFNNLLTGIIGHAQLLHSVLTMPEDREMAASILTAGERAAELTRQLLAYSGKGAFQLAEIDVSSLVRDTEALIRASLPGKIRLVISTGGVAPIMADANQIRQAILNLTLNAGEAIGEGEGLVTVSTGMARVQPGERFDISSEAAAAGDYAWIEIRDTGSGMDPALLEQIFEPFFSTKFLGRGLGLAAVAGIIRSHRGMLRVESSPGSGSCFRLYFPALPARPPEKAAPEQENGEPAVLVVDDEAVVRQIVKVALERAGRRVIVADSGESALDIFRRERQRIGLVLLDWRMPGMDGAETLTELRKIAPDVKVIVSSGLPRADTEYQFRDVNLAGYLQKPYRMSELTKLVNAILSK